MSESQFENLLVRTDRQQSVDGVCRYSDFEESLIIRRPCVALARYLQLEFLIRARFFILEHLKTENRGGRRQLEAMRPGRLAGDHLFATIGNHDHVARHE